MFLAFVAMLSLCEQRAVCPPYPGNLKPGGRHGTLECGTRAVNVSHDNGIEIGVQNLHVT